VKLDQLSVRDFVTELGSGNATPGGGSVAAFCGALGAALSGMVSKLTVGRERFKQTWQSMEEVKQKAEELTGRFLELVQDDTEAYQKVTAAFELSKETEEEKASRQAAIEEAMKQAATVPLETLRAAEKLGGIAREAIQRGNPNAITDAVAAVQLANTTAVVASYNVQINLSRIKDQTFVASCEKEVDEVLKRLDTLFADVDGNTNIYLT
jgi:formiminotetrahydrofolate cyclodeaminase